MHDNELGDTLKRGFPLRFNRPMRQFIARHESELSKNGGGELRFVLEVLSCVSGLPWPDLGFQVEFHDALGKVRRADFTIPLPGGAVLALEVDGWDKTGSGSGMNRAEFDDWLVRQNALTLSGYSVLRFSNAQVSRSPFECARCIEWALRGSCVPLPAVFGFQWAWFITSPVVWAVAGFALAWFIWGRG